MPREVAEQALRKCPWRTASATATTAYLEEVRKLLPEEQTAGSSNSRQTQLDPEEWEDVVQTVLRETDGKAAPGREDAELRIANSARRNPNLSACCRQSFDIGLNAGQLLVLTT